MLSRSYKMVENFNKNEIIKFKGNYNKTLNA